MQVTPTVVAPGQYANLTWASANAKLGTVNGYGTVAPNGTVQINPTQPMTFTGTFTGSNGQIVTCSAAVTVSAVQTPVHQVAYNQPRPHAPYITLSQVPYTGLDLGPVGTILYWSFLVFWCLFMAYVLVIKRVHYRLARSLKGFLYGTDEEEEEEDTIETIPAHAPMGHHPLPTASTFASAPQGDEIDEFILSQVHRGV